jgi:hypothetical protein
MLRLSDGEIDSKDSNTEKHPPGGGQAKKTPNTTDGVEWFINHCEVF